MHPRPELAVQARLECAPPRTGSRDQPVRLVSWEAARQLASRARRRVQGEAQTPDADLNTQREVIDAFLAAAREGDLEALLEALDPDVVRRADTGAASASDEELGVWGR